MPSSAVLKNLEKNRKNANFMKFDIAKCSFSVVEQFFVMHQICTCDCEVVFCLVSNTGFSWQSSIPRKKKIAMSYGALWQLHFNNICNFLQEWRQFIVASNKEPSQNMLPYHLACVVVCRRRQGFQSVIWNEHRLSKQSDISSFIVQFCWFLPFQKKNSFQTSNKWIITKQIKTSIGTAAGNCFVFQLLHSYWLLISDRDK